MKNYYRNLRNELIFKIENSELKNFVKIHEENSGLHFLISINSKFSGKTLEMRLKKNGIKISALKDGSHESTEVPHIHSTKSNEKYVQQLKENTVNTIAPYKRNSTSLNNIVKHLNTRKFVSTNIEKGS